jgi:F0F1-type ATP synthase assembly protein I
MGPGSPRSTRQQLLAFAGIGTTIFACVVVGMALGYAADRWLHTQPWLLLVGLGFGIAAAAVNLVRVIRDMQRLDRERIDDEGPRDVG